MNYRIEQVDITDSKIEAQLIMLFKEAFQTQDLLPRNYLYNNTFTKKASSNTIFLAAIEHNEIIGCSGFMATDFFYNGRIYNCYQAVWAATHPKHQGKRIFININNEAKKILKEKGAGFIYALAGDSSHYIFTNKLGFKEIPSVMVKIPNIPFIKEIAFEKRKSKTIDFYKSSTFCPVEHQFIDLKKNTGNGDVVEVKVNDSLLWGRLKTKNTKLGIVLKYFYVGGIILEDVDDFKSLFDSIFSNYKIHYIQIVSCQNNLYNSLIKKWKPAKMHGFLFYELNTKVENVNIFYGAIDVF